MVLTQTKDKARTRPVLKSFFIAMIPALFATADSITDFEWGTVSATSLLGWYLWYTTKVVFPKHEERMAELQTRSADDMRQQRDHYEDILEDMQRRHEARHSEIVTSLQEIARSLKK